MICRICGTLASGIDIGIYQVQKLLGNGRSGQAYLAVHQRSGQPVVIKVFPAEAETTKLWEQARREVRVTTALRHPAIVSVFSCSTWQPEQMPGPPRSTRELIGQGRQQDTYLLTLCQYIPGTFQRVIAHYQQRETQRALYERGITPNAIYTNIVQQAGSALSTTHARNIVHGALVPGNLLFASHDRIWIADFGLARLHPPSTPYLPPELYAASQAALHNGNAMAYWRAVTPASDQYMFGMLCQQFLSQVLHANDYEPLQPVLQRATHQKPERRYPSIELFVQDLVTLLNPHMHSAASSQLPQLQAPALPQIRTQGTGRAYPTTPAAPLMPAGPRGPQGPHTPPANRPVPGLPDINSNPLTPALPATPLTPAIPATAEDWEKRGDKLFTLHDYHEALVAYQRAIEINSEKAVIWMALGDTYFALERYKEALMSYEQAMYLDPNDAQIWANRGTALDALGRHQEAIDCYERAEQLQ